MREHHELPDDLEDAVLAHDAERHRDDAHVLVGEQVGLDGDLVPEPEDDADEGGGE